MRLIGMPNGRTGICMPGMESMLLMVGIALVESRAVVESRTTIAAVSSRSGGWWPCCWASNPRADRSIPPARAGRKRRSRTARMAVAESSMVILLVVVSREPVRLQVQGLGDQLRRWCKRWGNGRVGALAIEIDTNAVILGGRNASGWRSESGRARPSARRDPGARRCRAVGAAMVLSLGPRRRTVAVGQR